MKNINDEIALEAQQFFGESVKTNTKRGKVVLWFASMYFQDVGDLEHFTLKIGNFVDKIGWEHDLWLSSGGLSLHLNTPKNLQLPNIIIEKNTKEEIVIHYGGNRKFRRDWLHSSKLGVDIDAQKERSLLYSGMDKITITPVANFNEWGREDGWETLESYLEAIQDGFMSNLSEFGSIHNPTKGYFRVS